MQLRAIGLQVVQFPGTLGAPADQFPIPDANGGIPAEQLNLAAEIGGWLKTNGVAIYGTEGGPWYPDAWGGSTRNGKKIYVQLLSEAPETVVLPPCGVKVLSARLVGGEAIAVKTTGAGLELTVPNSLRDPKVTVVELTLDQEVTGMVEASKPKAAVKKKADAVPPPREEIKKPTP